MKVELNIGLNVAGGDNRPVTLGSRRDKARRVLSECDGVTAFDARTQTVEYTREGIDHTEATLICAFEWEHRPDWLQATVHMLARAMNQDCIAVYYPDGIPGWYMKAFTHPPSGELIGPNAAAWGAFDLSQFTRFEREQPAHEKINYSDWQYEVANGDTRLGFNDWQTVTQCATGEHRGLRDISGEYLPAFNNDPRAL